jgi:hypothetical protein
LVKFLLAKIKVVSIIKNAFAGIPSRLLQSKAQTAEADPLG